MNAPARLIAGRCYRLNTGQPCTLLRLSACRQYAVVKTHNAQIQFQTKAERLYLL